MRLIKLLIFIFSVSVYSQNYNTKKGIIANGYDVVAYFNNKAIKGIKNYSTKYDNVIFNFSSKKNLTLFKKNPTKYIPQYGGYCAYAIGKTGEKVSVDPKTFEVRDNKLYLFYNSWGTNTLKLWLKEDVKQLIKQANLNWKKIITK